MPDRMLVVPPKRLEHHILTYADFLKATMDRINAEQETAEPFYWCDLMGHQSDLLSYLGQQLIAHGATLFAIIVALFTLIAGLQARPFHSEVSAVSYIVLIFALSTAAAYTGFRMLYYGKVVNAVIAADEKEMGFLKYYLNVVENVGSYVSYRNWSNLWQPLAGGVALTVLIVLTLWGM